jgi:hypothetical protein
MMPLPVTMARNKGDFRLIVMPGLVPGIHVFLLLN